jgi:hypothetical protein
MILNSSWCSNNFFYKNIINLIVFLNLYEYEAFLIKQSIISLDLILLLLQLLLNQNLYLMLQIIRKFKHIILLLEIILKRKIHEGLPEITIGWEGQMLTFYLNLFLLMLSYLFILMYVEYFIIR